MLVHAQELINDNGISAIAIGFFTALFAAVSAVGVAVVNSRHKTEELKDVTVKAAESAEAAQANTQNVSNGFVDRMDRKLDTVIQQQDNLENALTRHLEWHLNTKAQKGLD